MDDGFDFNAWLDSMKNVSGSFFDEEGQLNLEQEMPDALSEVMPRLWSVVQDQMRGGDAAQMNAVLNAMLIATVTWIGSCAAPGKVVDDAIEEMLIDSWRKARAMRSEQLTREMADIAYNAGKLKLMEDTLDGLAKTLVQNSIVIKNAAETIKEARKK